MTSYLGQEGVPTEVTSRSCELGVLEDDLGVAEAAQHLRQLDTGISTSFLTSMGIDLSGLGPAEIESIVAVTINATSEGQAPAVVRRKLPVEFKSDERVDTIANTLMAWAMSQESLDSYRMNGVAKVKWLAENDSCSACKRNRKARAIPVGRDFPSGHNSPPAHADCRCAITPAF